MAVLAKVSTLRERLPSVRVDPYASTIAVPRTKLWLLFVLCAQRAVQEPLDRRAWAYAMFTREFIWTAATVLFAQVRTGFFDAYRTLDIQKTLSVVVRRVQ